ncbi:MAG: helix-turn-helix transcriptional regulator [Anaerolineales bacterium]|jgi:DNA-binding NarL/FixJ family response regulator
MSIWERIRSALGLESAARLPDPSRLYALYLDVELVEALQEIADLEKRSRDEVAAYLLALALERRRAAEVNLQHWRGLTEREQQVVSLYCQGYGYRQIAAQLVISPDTVKTHLRNSVRKFGFKRRVQLRAALEDWDFSNWQAANLPAGLPQEHAASE